MTVLAHAAHWLTTLVYVVPLLVFVLWLVFITVRDRLSRDEDDAEQAQ